MMTMTYYERIIAAFAAEAGPTDAWIDPAEGGCIVLPTVGGKEVVASVEGDHWEATLMDSSTLATKRLEDGPLISAQDSSVVAWLRRACDAEPDQNVRSYVVGLPVLITVNPDGSVQVEVDLSEADDQRILADHAGVMVPEAALVATDARRIRAAINAKTVKVTSA